MNYDVMFLGESFPMPMGGGSVNYVFRLLSEVNAFSFVVVTGNASPNDNTVFDNTYNHKIERSRWLPHVLKPYKGGVLKKASLYFLSFIVCMYYIFKYRPRVVFLTEFSYLSIPVLVANFFLKYKIGIFTYAEEITQIQSQKRKIDLLLLKSTLLKSSGIVSVCDYTSDLICNICDVGYKIIKIIPPIKRNDSLFNKESKGSRSREIVLLTVARLEERKGHIDVIKSIARLKEVYPNISYNIVGTGPFVNSIREAIDKYNVADSVHLLNKLSDEELDRQYALADIFVMPHKLLANGDTEGCPTVFLEAGSYCLPVIGGDAGGVSDAIIHGETGFICNHNREDDLYNYLTKLITDVHLRSIMGEAGRRYSSHFYIEKQSKLFNDFVKSIL